MRVPLRLAVGAALLLPGIAAAEPIGPTQAQALQQQLKDWIAGLLGPSIKLPELPWTVSGEGDHYLITWPLTGFGGQSADLKTTVSVRPLDGGRWSIDDMHMPSSGTFTVNLPDTTDHGMTGPLKIEFQLGHQQARGVIDPNLATESALHAEVGKLAVTTENADQRQEQRFDSYVVDTSLKPAQDGRLDLVMDAVVNGWKTASDSMGGTPVAIGIQAMRATGRVQGINRDKVATLLAAAGNLIGALPPDASTKDSAKDLPPSARAQLRLMADSLQGMMSGVTLEESVDGLQVEIAGIGGLTLKHFVLGFGGEAPDGRLRAWINLALSELASPSLPPKLASFLPRHAQIKPSISGIMMADLHKLLMDATEPDADDKLQPDIAAIFAHGGANVGVEALSFDLGPAAVTGKGQIKILSPDTWHAEARLTATGLDDLAAQARTNPELQEALPFLIMIRGLGKPEGKALVWDIVSDGPSVTVNGLDLSQLGGNGEKPKGKSPATKPGQPPRR